jgi:hypothetical protein
MARKQQDQRLPLIEDVMSRIPSEVIAALNGEQLGKLRAAIAETRPWREHSINIRLSLPLFSRRLFITLVGGIDQRNAERRAADRVAHPLGTPTNLTFLSLLAIGLYALAGVVAFLAALAFRG